MYVDKKWDVLSQEMRLENNADEVFLKSRISAESLYDAYCNNLAAIVDNGVKIAAIGVLWKTSIEGWFELGSLYVSPESRGKGFAHYIYERRLQLLPAGARCFTISHNVRVASLATRHGFREASAEDWMRLAPYEITCGPCDRVVLDKARCPHRAKLKECRLFVL